MRGGISISIIENKVPREAPPVTKDNVFDSTQNFKLFLTVLKEHHIEVAKEILNEELAKGFDPNYTRQVDNVFGKRESEVRDFGKIVYLTRSEAGLGESLAQCFELLEKSSPVGKTGHYKSAHVLLYNGRLVADSSIQVREWIGTDDFSNIKFKDIFHFVNLQPYARRLEFLGVTGSRKSVKWKATKRTRKGLLYSKMEEGKQFLQTPNGTYSVVYRQFNRILKGSAVAKFGFFAGGELGSIASRPYLTAVGRKPYRTTFKKGGRPYIYPTIVIGVAEGSGAI